MPLPKSDDLDEPECYLQGATLESLLDDCRAHGVAQTRMARMFRLPANYLSSVKRSERKEHYFNFIGACRLVCLYVLALDERVRTGSRAGVAPGHPALKPPALPMTGRLEAFIGDWHWDEASHEFAREAGSFLFQFIAEVETAGLAEQTLRKHVSNCQLIGYFTCQLGGYKTFSPSIFAGSPAYLYEFRRKVSKSDSMVSSYQTTWRKLARYARSLMRAKTRQDETRAGDNSEGHQGK